MLYAACAEVDINTNTGVCEHVVYVDTPTVFPALSVKDGQTIGLKVLGCWAVGYVWRVVISSIRGFSNAED